ncbi:deoxycytidylate deaminase [Spiroplasma clarkii]|uniref:deoxycytidylate deaminase n=1 Tax=Spiroplasma clarkii TaxID=2139 RepID=UPI000B55FC26|nr:dCMP deaminase family protein [Spiroplasma clarkii]ARU91425.1 deoxycytidylate deaminase [Spiroplasma clarkii]
MTKRTNYIDWDTYFLAMVKLIAMRSKDPSTQVGAVIVNDLFQVVSTGYNGFPRGISDDEFPWTREGDWTQTKYPYVVHAELNAILSSNTNVRDCTMYTSLFPCNECSKSIIQSGIKKLFILVTSIVILQNFKFLKNANNCRCTIGIKTSSRSSFKV